MNLNIKDFAPRSHVNKNTTVENRAVAAVQNYPTFKSLETECQVNIIVF